MLRNVVETFLDTVTEREFDAPLMALLAAQGFSDIHFTHGANEFGKDIIAKRVDGDPPKLRQYAIQAKAGDIGMSDWRSIRPQVEEAERNTLSHPNFDERLPRTAVLVTTGRLVGGAPLDAQQVAQRSRRSGRRFVTWERPQLAEWLSADPTLTLGRSDGDLLQLLASIDKRSVREQELEYFSRRWLSRPGLDNETARLGNASVEAAVIANRLRAGGRLDLAAYVALHLLRAAWAGNVNRDPENRPQLATGATRLFGDYVVSLLGEALPLLNDPADLLASVFDPLSIVTYPTVCCRLGELFALLALIEEFEPELLTATSNGTAGAAVLSLVRQHPGTCRPISDEFAVSVIAPAIVLYRIDPATCRSYWKNLTSWTLERFDDRADGLGVGAIGESEELLTERLLGAPLESTNVTRRRSSYLATVLLDIAAALSLDDLYDALQNNLKPYQIYPTLTVAENSSVLNRFGRGTRPIAAVNYRTLSARGSAADHHTSSPTFPLIDELLITSSIRSRHSYRAIVDARSF